MFVLEIYIVVIIIFIVNVFFNFIIEIGIEKNREKKGCYFYSIIFLKLDCICKMY